MVDKGNDTENPCVDGSIPPAGTIDLLDPLSLTSPISITQIMPKVYLWHGGGNHALFAPQIRDVALIPNLPGSTANGLRQCKFGNMWDVPDF
jgi:hypothetical protein